MQISRHLGWIRLLVALLACVGWASAHANPWVRHDPGNRGVIVFVHGAMGDGRYTWTSGNAYWPEMLKDDSAFKGQDIYVYEYSSPRFDIAPSIDQLADNMRLRLETDKVLEHEEITFISHSMGGIVTRAFILRYRKEVARKIRMLYFFATPTTGTSYSKIAALISENPQYKQLYPMEAGSYLSSLLSDWLAADLPIRSYCAYELRPIHGQIIVDEASATHLCNKRLDPIDADHRAIVKPKDRNSDSYRAFEAAFVDSAPLPKRSAPIHAIAKAQTSNPAPPSAPPAPTTHDCPGKGENPYNACSDAQLGQWAIDQSEQMQEFLRRLPQGDTPSDTHGAVAAFTSGFRDNIVVSIKVLRTELLRRLGPSWNDRYESGAWEALDTIETSYGSPGLIDVAVEYAPRLRKMGLMLKRREIPGVDPIQIPHEMKSVPPGPLQGTFAWTITLTAPKQFDSGYIAVVFDQVPMSIGRPDLQGALWPLIGDVSNKGLKALLEQGVSRVTVIAIGPTAFIPDVPIHFFASANHPINIVEVKWFDE